MEEETIQSHKIARSRYGSTALVWSEVCAAYAQQWADYLATSGEWKHGNLDGTIGRMGQNIAMGGKNFTVTKAVDAWMEESKDYDYERGGYQPGLGHFTQMVWRSTRECGAGKAKRGNRTIIVVNYFPAGNLADFSFNVPHPS